MMNVSEFPPPKEKTKGITMTEPGTNGITEAKANAINEDKMDKVSDELIREVFQKYEEIEDRRAELAEERKALTAERKEYTEKLVQLGMKHKGIAIAWDNYRAHKENSKEYQRIKITSQRIQKVFKMDDQVEMFDA